MNVGCNYLREHMIPEARIHYAYIDAGGTAPNVVQDLSLIHIWSRYPEESMSPNPVITPFSSATRVKCAVKERSHASRSTFPVAHTSSWAFV